MTDWKEFKLKLLCNEITVGHVGAMAGEYQDSGIPFLRSRNIKPFCVDYEELKFIDKNFHARLKKSELRPGDVAVVRTGYPGAACVIPKSLGVANCSDLVIIRPGKDLNASFLAAVFNSVFGQQLVAGNLVGVAQQHFNITIARELKLKLPPKDVQDKIAAILCSYDDFIENNKRRIALLEKMAEEIYREWFVRFRFPGYDKVKFEKGVPTGWIYQDLGDLCKVITRGISPAYDEDSEHLVVNQRCIRDGQIDFSLARRHKTRIPKDKRIQQGDVLVNSTGVGTLGRVSVVECEDSDFTVDSHVTICRVNEAICGIYYLAHTVRRLQSYFEYMASGATGQVELNRGIIANTRVLVPSQSIQDKFGEIASIIWRKKYLLRRTVKNMISTRDLLLPRLISGKLSVENLDIRFPPSMEEADGEA